MARRDPDDLTPRETEIAEAYASGTSSRVIAIEFGIAHSTVKTHLRTIYEKLGVANKVQLSRSLKPVQPARVDPAMDGRPARVAVLRPFDPTAGDAGPRLTGIVAQALTVALGAYPDVRLVLPFASGRPPERSECAGVAKALGVDYLVIPTFGQFTDGADLLVQLVDAAGTVRSQFRRRLPLPPGSRRRGRRSLRRAGRGDAR